MVGVPGRVVENHRTEAEALEHGKLPDPFAMVINLLMTEQSVLEERVKKLEQAAGTGANAEPESHEDAHRELVHALSVFDEGGGI